jgi:hypothetical protein
MYKLIEVKMLLTEPFSPIAAIMEQNNNILFVEE